MTLISRRDVLAGLAASSAACIVTARSEECRSSAAGNERRHYEDALLRYFAADAPQLLQATKASWIGICWYWK
jgi:hypothetical protein